MCAAMCIYLRLFQTYGMIKHKCGGGKWRWNAEGARVYEQAEDFLRAHSTTASVPSAPLSVLQASAEALETNLDQKQPGQFGTNSSEQALEPEGDLQRDQSEGSSLPAPGECIIMCLMGPHAHVVLQSCHGLGLTLEGYQ